MKFRAEMAEAMAKSNCKTCWGRGKILVQVGADGFPIIYRKFTQDGNIITYGNPIVQTEQYCQCSRKKIEKLEELNKKLMKKLKEEELLDNELNQQFREESDV